MRLKDLPVSERPREKLLKYGKENLSDSELLAIILKTGTRELSAVDLGVNLLKEIDDLANLRNLSYESLINVKGIGQAKAIELLAVCELCKRMYYNVSTCDKERFSTPDIIYKNNKYLFDGVKQEHFYCLYLDSKSYLIERKLLFMGTVNKSVVHPREIFKEAYKLSASSIVCIHNHPSGDKTPSSEDIYLTRNLMEIGNMNGIPVVDHIIFTSDDYYSFYENSRFKDSI